jgi:hypothetical protein
MSVGSRPAMPTMPARQPAFRARRDRLVTSLATFVLTAAVAVLIVAATAVAFTIT